MRHLATVSACLVLICSPGALQSQVQSPLQVEAFGGQQAPLPRLVIPPELKSFVPAGFILRAVLPAKMSSAGETLFLYDNGAEAFPEIHLHALREGNEYKLFDGTISGIAGLLCLPSKASCQFVAFAYHQGGDLADTTFAIFGYQNSAYRSILQQNTTEGRMRVLPGSPLQFEVWSANTDLDSPEPEKSCVWCPHRYRIQTFVHKDDTFSVVADRTTEQFLDPGDIAAKGFVTSGKKD